MGTSASQETLLIKIFHSEHTTWQGSINWVDHQKKQHFRSALEFIKLVRDELEQQEEQEVRMTS